ncbi:hypothetical protein [Phaeobacter sp. C3_T13_0]|uniref:hypothetical protein n=1 Tax=Phaeobacter cretensis TaxID=3342641 RepID=UPI0039BC2F7E
MVDKIGKPAPAEMGADEDKLDLTDLRAAEMTLDDLFAGARADAPALSDTLEMAILDEADAVQSAILDRSSVQSDLAAVTTSGAAVPAGPVDMGGRFIAGLRDLLAGLGGWPALGGLATASAAGLWIGLAPPSFLPDPVSLAGIELSADGLPDDSYDLAVVLSEEME